MFPMEDIVWHQFNGQNTSTSASTNTAPVGIAASLNVPVQSNSPGWRRREGSLVFTRCHRLWGFSVSSDMNWKDASTDAGGACWGMFPPGLSGVTFWIGPTFVAIGEARELSLLLSFWFLVPWHKHLVLLFSCSLVASGTPWMAAGHFAEKPCLGCISSRWRSASPKPTQKVCRWL